MQQAAAGQTVSRAGAPAKMELAVVIERKLEFVLERFESRQPDLLVSDPR
jgi:hypothetical protein